MPFMHNNPGTATAIIALTAALALSGCASRSERDNHASIAPHAVAVETSTVQSTDFPRTIAVTGSVAAEFEADISTRTMGRVKSVLVKEGDTVRRGQPLIELDASDLDAGIAQARADVESAVTQVGNAKAALNIEEASSPARVREAQAKVAEALAAVKSTQAQRDLVIAGPRRQERERAGQAVAESDASLTLARTTFQRMSRLYRMEAISGQQFDEAKSAYDAAQAQYQSAVLMQSQTDEGSRPQEKRAAIDAVREAQAQLAQARAGLAQAQAATLTVDVRRADLLHAQSGVAQAQAALAMAEANRAYATIRAPFDGVVTSRLVDPGAMAGPGVPLLKIQGGSMRLEASVPETALPAAKVGSHVDVALAAVQNRLITGRVVSLARQGDVTSHTFLAKILLPAGCGAVSGMYGRADLTIGVDHAPAVPAQAVISKDGLSYVYVVGADNIARLRFVTTGSSTDGKVPLLSGATAGEQVVVSDPASVQDGMHVDRTVTASVASAQTIARRN